LKNRGDLSIKVFYLDKAVDPNIRMAVYSERLIRKKISFSDYDIVHTNGLRPDLVAFMNRKKIRYHISTVHNFVFEDLAFSYNRFISCFFGKIWLVIWNRADKLICVSRTMKSYYSKWFSPAKLGVIYNGIEETDNSLSPDIDVIRSINDFHSQGLKVLGSVGILTKRKGIDHVMYLVAADNRLAFVIIGEGKELQNLINLSERLNITNRCLFCGFRNNAVKYVRYFDLFIMPSKSEGFGLALIEAVQQKVPVICSDIEVFKELFNSAEVSYFKLEDLTSLSEALKIAIETGSVKADLAYVRYLNNYTASLMAGEYYKLYKNV